MSIKIPENRVKVFATKTCRFRANVRKDDGSRYEVTVGGSEWLGGKGREVASIVIHKCNVYIFHLLKYYWTLLGKPGNMYINHRKTNIHISFSKKD